MTTANKYRPSSYKEKLSNRPECKNWWVGYDEQPGVQAMFCSVCEKWAEISKGNHVHQMWIKDLLKNSKQSTEKNYKCMKNLAKSPKCHYHILPPKFS